MPACRLFLSHRAEDNAYRMVFVQCTALLPTMTGTAVAARIRWRIIRHEEEVLLVDHEHTPFFELEPAQKTLPFVV